MIIRKATENDIDSIAKIYEAIHDEEEKGMAVIGWIRNVYPTRKTAEDGVTRDDLFVLEDEGIIVAAAVINQIQVEEYQYATWKHSAGDAEVMVLHALVVDPYMKRRGYGKAFVAFYENYAKEVVDDSYQGSIKNFICAFTAGRKVDDAEKKELLAYINTL